MINFKLSHNVKGIIGVSFTNVISVIISMLISFVLPLFLSVEDYGYWQLYVLYSGYVGILAFGFNDGIHLNYGGRDYDRSLWREESAYIKFLTVLSVAETVIVNIILLIIPFEVKTKYWVLVMTSLNILPTILCGMISYINQSAMRYWQYATGYIVERVVFVLAMAVLIVLGVRDPLVFIGTYTASKYTTIVYHLITSREAFKEPPAKLSTLRRPIKANFSAGIVLMIAATLNTSIIIFSRLLVERNFGIAEFSAYSFSLHTLTVASQVIVAVTAVFYPILKRCDVSKLRDAYKSFDRSSSILSALLLLTYYPAAILISCFYSKYAPTLSYLFVVYPLFIFQCKSNLLIINTYKVRMQTGKMLLMNAVGVLINAALTVAAYLATKSVPMIAAAALLGFIIWYYLCQMEVHKQYGWKLDAATFSDCLITAVFIAVNYFAYQTQYSVIEKALLGFAVCLLILAAAYLVFRRGIKQAIKNTLAVLDQ